MPDTTGPVRRQPRVRRILQADRPAPRWVALVVLGLATLTLCVSFSLAIQTDVNQPTAEATRERGIQEYRFLEGLNEGLYRLFVGIAVWSAAVAVTAGATAVTRSHAWAKATAAVLLIGALLAAPTLLAEDAFITIVIMVVLAVAMIRTYPTKRRGAPRTRRETEVAGVF